MSSFQGLGEVIARQGLFGALYADRGSHYWITKAADQGIDEETPTQVKRALDQLAITLIPASCPEARGRSERMFGTLQGRLPQELRAAGITTMAAANQYLSEVFLPAHNAAFRVSPAEPGSAFIPYIGHNLSDILCLQDDRIVARDNCVSYRRLSLQIPPDRHRHHYVKAKVRVHEYPDGRLALFHGPRCLARYHADGTAHRREGPCKDSRLNPLGELRPVDLWTTLPRCPQPHRANNSGQIMCYLNRTTLRVTDSRGRSSVGNMRVVRFR